MDGLRRAGHSVEHRLCAAATPMRSLSRPHSIYNWNPDPEYDHACVGYAGSYYRTGAEMVEANPFPNFSPYLFNTPLIAASEEAAQICACGQPYHRSFCSRMDLRIEKLSLEATGTHRRTHSSGSSGIRVSSCIVTPNTIFYVARACDKFLLFLLS